MAMTLMLFMYLENKEKGASESILRRPFSIYIFFLVLGQNRLRKIDDRNTKTLKNLKSSIFLNKNFRMDN